MLEKPLVDRLIKQATRAPSSHNTQPWFFKIKDDHIQLHADRTRALPVNDPDDRELVISCGCALFNLRCAAATEGLGTTVIPFPDAHDNDLLADVVYSGEADNELAKLAGAITKRRTYRKRFAEKSVSDDLLNALMMAAGVEGAWLEPIEGADARSATSGLVSEGDAVQWANPSWRRELAQWMHPRRSGDGLSLPWLAVPIAQLVVRSFDMGGGVGAKDSELAENSPVLAVLGTVSDGVADRLAAGQALERVLLTAAEAGLQASYLNQPIQVELLRPKLCELCKSGGYPQVLLRLGYQSEELPETPRRPVADVLQQ
jgi:hypothetical protein